VTWHPGLLLFNTTRTQLSTKILKKQKFIGGGMVMMTKPRPFYDLSYRKSQPHSYKCNAVTMLQQMLQSRS
jgi:hypothetical protein